MKFSTKLCFCLFFSLLNTSVSCTATRTRPKAEPSSPIGPATTTAEKRPSLTLKYINQKLDHYSTNTHYFKQKYFVYKRPDYVPGNLVFLLVGGTTELKLDDLNKGIWNDFAKDSHALLLAVEHRMYGNSCPSEGDYSTKNLSYLNAKQALADLAFFIHEIVSHNNPADVSIPHDAKWVALGLSYGGTLAALLRSKYPTIITAAVTIDAPLLATLEFKDFYDIVENQYKMEVVDEIIKKAFDELKTRFNSCENNNTDESVKFNCVEEKITSLRAIFKFCDGGLSKKYNERDHKTFLFWSLATVLARAMNFGNGTGTKVKKDVIKILLDQEKTPLALNRLGAAVKLVLEKHNVNCLIIDYKSLIDNYRDTTLKANNNLNFILYTGLGNRQILYQHCSEWGQFQTAYKTDGIFAELIPIDFYVHLCRKVFEQEFTKEYLEKAISSTNSLYGGREIDVSKVMFTKGENDIWINLGFTGRQPLHEITSEMDSIIVLLKEEDRAEKANIWNFILSTLETWTGVRITRANNIGKNRGQTSTQVARHVIGA